MQRIELAHHAYARQMRLSTARRAGGPALPIGGKVFGEAQNLMETNAVAGKIVMLPA